MRRITLVIVVIAVLLVLTFFALKNFQFFGLGAIIYGILTNVGVPPDVTVVSAGVPDRTYGPAISDLERCDLIRQAVREMKAGDTLLLSEGRFDCDCKNRGNLLFPNNVTVTGAGMDKTHLFSNCWSDDQGIAFEVRSGTYSDLTFENQSWQINEDGRTIGMYEGIKRTPDNVHQVFENGVRVVEEPKPGPFTATFGRVKFIGNAWVIYDWSTRGNTWNIRDSVVVSGRQGVSMMAGGGSFQNAYILRTKFDIDTMRSQDIGWTSNKLVGGGYGVVARGGNVKVEDSEFHMKCGTTPSQYSWVPRCVGVFDGNNFGSDSSAWTYIELINNRWFINGNGSPDTYDIFMTNEGVKEKLIVSGGCGSGLNCLITKNWSSSTPTLTPTPTPTLTPTPTPTLTPESTPTSTLSAVEIPSACSGITLTRILQKGSIGTDVKCVKAFLNTNPSTKVAVSGPGSPGNETIYYGSLTMAAVKKFQAIHGTGVLGIVGLKTGAKINQLLTGVATPLTITNKTPTPTSTSTTTPTRIPTSTSKPIIIVSGPFKRDLSFGNKGEDVTALQNFLKSQGSAIYPEGVVDGYFGEETKKGVQRFQVKYGLSKPGAVGFGVFGPETRSKANSIINIR